MSSLSRATQREAMMIILLILILVILLKQALTVKHVQVLLHRGTLAAAGTFLRGVLDKVGVEPELVRIGKFKSAGDQLLRTDMSVRASSR